MSEASTTSSSDPLKSIADAMETAVEAAKQGVAEASAAATDAAPAATQLLSSLVYKACYGISYGVVFPTVLVAKSLPKNNAMMHGFADGAKAAMDVVAEMRPGTTVTPGEASS